jgi:SMI1 / KNR4 family (SUKH-1)
MTDAYSNSSRVTDWRRAIGVLILIHQHIKDLDQEGIWANELPRVAAPQETLAQIESQLGETLDECYRAFLTCADGWRAFYQWVDLFGSPELLGERMELARTRLCELARQGVLSKSGYSEGDLLPIAMTRPGERDSDPDLFAVLKHHRPGSGIVFWFADEEIDRFKNFDAFFLAMLDYNREELQDLSKSIEERNRLM